MQKSIAFVLCGCLLSLGLYGQSPGIERILQAIEQNNQELKALEAGMESKRLELKSGNNLPNPQLGTYYLPFGDHVGGDYTEFQLTQSFEFPSVYSARNSLIEQLSIRMELDYQVKRQEILLTAQAYCVELIHLNKRRSVEQERVQQAKTVLDHVQALFEKEEVSILDFNKAKVAWLQEQFKIEQIDSEKQNVLLLLMNLNGGKELTFDESEFLVSLDLSQRDSIWQNKVNTDPWLKQLKQQEAIAQQEVKLSRNQSLPNLSAGFNYQGVNGANYSGIYAGLSIPLWSNRNKVKAAETRYSFRKSLNAFKAQKVRTNFEKRFNEYLILLSKFREYQNTLEGLNSDQLLLQSYRLGQISFMEYYMELQFYRQAYDAMLDMENQLYQSRADLLKHQL